MRLHMFAKQMENERTNNDIIESLALNVCDGSEHPKRLV